MIVNTYELPKSDNQYYLDKMVESGALFRDTDDSYTLTKAMGNALKTQLKYGITKFVKDELGDKNIHNGAYPLSTPILLGLCLVVLKIQGDDLFHCINIILKIEEVPQIQNFNCSPLLNWINRFSTELPGSFGQLGV